MHGTVKESRDLAAGIQRQLEDLEGREVVLFPPHLYLGTVHAALDDSRIGLGAQNCGWEAKGAFTGEVSPVMLKEAGCTYVIIGHSERRHILGESNDQINKKVRACFEHSLTPILCVGELLEERSMGDAHNVVERHLSRGLEGVEAADASGMVIAYEPVWAIGTGEVASLEQVSAAHASIRKFLGTKAGSDNIDSVRLLYGGSVNKGNAAAIMSLPEVDGVLVGGASMQPDSFIPIIEYDS